MARNLRKMLQVFCLLLPIYVFANLSGCSESGLDTVQRATALQHAEQLYLQEDFLGAEQVLNSVGFVENPSVASLNLRGRIKVALLRDQEAELLFRAATELGSDNLDSWLALLQVNQRLGQLTAAEKDLDAAKNHFPDNLFLKLEAGKILFAQGDYSKSVKLFRQVILRDSMVVDAYYFLGSALIKSGDKQAGLDFMQKHKRLSEAFNKLKIAKQVVDIEPDEAVRWYNLARAYELTGDDSSAIVAYHTSIKLEPVFPEAFNNLGIILFRNGRTREAGKAFADAISLADSIAKYHFNLGAVYAKIGNNEYARKHWVKALQLDPGYSRAREFLDQLPRLAD